MRGKLDTKTDLHATPQAAFDGDIRKLRELYSNFEEAGPMIQNVGEDGYQKALLGGMPDTD